MVRSFEKAKEVNVLAGINGGFFDVKSGETAGFILRDNDMLVFNIPPGITRSMVGFTKSTAGKGAKALISSPGEMPKYWLKTTDDPAEDYLVSMVNASRSINSFAVYTPAYGDSTHTNKYGAEIIVSKRVSIRQDGSEEFWYGVDEVRHGAGNSGIPKDGFVISLHGKASEYAKAFPKGAKVSRRWSLPDGWQQQGVVHGIMAGPRLLMDGKIYVTAKHERLSGLRSRDRTVLGITRQGKVLFVWLHTTERRNIDFYEAANILKKMGCVEAIGLDSGSSSSFYYNGKQKVVNHSGAPVPNGLVVIHNNKPAPENAKAIGKANGEVPSLSRGAATGASANMAGDLEAALDASIVRAVKIAARIIIFSPQENISEMAGVLRQYIVEGDFTPEEAARRLPSVKGDSDTRKKGRALLAAMVVTAKNDLCEETFRKLYWYFISDDYDSSAEPIIGSIAGSILDKKSDTSKKIFKEACLIAGVEPPQSVGAAGGDMKGAAKANEVSADARGDEGENKSGPMRKKELMDWLIKSGIRQERSASNRIIAMSGRRLFMPSYYKGHSDRVIVYRNPSNPVRIIAIVDKENPENFVVFEYKDNEIHSVESGQQLVVASYIKPSGTNNSIPLYNLSKCTDFNRFDGLLNKETSKILNAGRSLHAIGMASSMFSFWLKVPVEVTDMQTRRAFKTRNDRARYPVVLKRQDGFQAQIEFYRSSADKFTVSGINWADGNLVIFSGKYFNLSVILELIKRGAFEGISVDARLYDIFDFALNIDDINFYQKMRTYELDEQKQIIASAERVYAGNIFDNIAVPATASGAAGDMKGAATARVEGEAAKPDSQIFFKALFGHDQQAMESLRTQGYKFFQILGGNGNNNVSDGRDAALVAAINTDLPETEFRYYIEGRWGSEFSIAGKEAVNKLFSELAGNIQHIGPGACMWFAVRQIEHDSNRGIEMVFIDNGIGIEDIPRACETFYTTKNPPVGGVGLQITRSLAAENPNNYLEIESRGKRVEYGHKVKIISDVTQKAGTFVRFTLLPLSQTVSNAGLESSAGARANMAGILESSFEEYEKYLERRESTVLVQEARHVRQLILREKEKNPKLDIPKKIEESASYSENHILTEPECNALISSLRDAWRMLHYAAGRGTGESGKATGAAGVTNMAGVSKTMPSQTDVAQVVRGSQSVPETEIRNGSASVGVAAGEVLAVAMTLKKAKERNLGRMVVVVGDDGLVLRLQQNGANAVGAASEAEAASLKSLYEQKNYFVVVINRNNNTLQLTGLAPIEMSSYITRAIDAFIGYDV